MSFQSGNLALHFEEMIFVASRDEYDALLITTQRYLLLTLESFQQILDSSTTETHVVLLKSLVLFCAELSEKELAF